MKKTEIFIPAFELDINTFKVSQKLSGKKFHNQDLSINFGGLTQNFDNEQEIVKLSIEHTGISGKFYILYSEVQRIVGVNIKLLSKEYIKYIFNRNIGCYGMQFERVIDKNEIENLPLLISATTNLQDKLYSVYFQTSELMVDSDFLSSRKCNWPSTLALSLDVAVYQVALDVEKLHELSNEDLILLRNR